MSEFVSNFISYSTATLIVGAGMLGSVDFSAVQNSGGRVVSAIHTQVLIESVADENRSTILVNADVTPVGVEANRIEQAVLQAVVFTRTGEQSGLTPLKQEAMGVVTGSSVNLRHGPGTNYAIAGRATGGEEMSVTGQTDGRWIEVISAVLGEPVWIHGKFFDAPQV